VSQLAPLAAAAVVKHNAALLRDARAVRRLWMHSPPPLLPSTTPALRYIAALRDAADRLGGQLTRREPTQQRRAKEAVPQLR